MQFTRTHYRRRDGLRAMLIGRNEGHAVYRIQAKQGRETVISTLRTSEAHFDAQFVGAAA